MACRCSSAGAGGCACVVDVADTPTVDLTATGTGDPATPRVISGDVKVSGAAGNTVVVNPDGLFVPPAAAVPPAVGCGLSVAGNQINLDLTPFADLRRDSCNALIDTDVPVPFDPACNTEGAPIYCDTNGVLRTLPEKMTDTNVRSMNEAFTPPITAYPYTTPQIELPVTNPSDCYCMCGFVQFAALPAITAAAGTVFNIFYEFDHDGDGVYNQLGTTTVDNRGKSAPSGFNQRIPLILNVCLDPGETVNFGFRVFIQRVATLDNGAAITMSGMSREIRWFGSNL